MTATHNPDISITVLMDPAVAITVGFSDLVYLVDEEDGNNLDGERLVAYDGVQAIAAARRDNHISEKTAKAAQVWFAQEPTPQRLFIGKVKTGEPDEEDYDEALAICFEQNPGIYGVAIDSREAEDIVAVASYVEATENKIFIAQNGDKDWLTKDVPSEFSSLQENERTFLCWHDDDEASMDLALAGKRLVFNPDFMSAPWYCRVASVPTYGSRLTSQERDFAHENCVNVGLEFGPSKFFIKRGHNLNGRPMYMIVTADWFRTRLQVDVATEIVKYSDRGLKIPVSEIGQRIVGSLVEARFDQGEIAGHFKPGQTKVIYPKVTLDDIEQERIRVDGEATFNVGGQDVTMIFHFVRADVNPEDEI